MHFALDARTEELRTELRDFIDTHVVPAEETFVDQVAALEDPWAWSTVPVLQDLRAEARRRGLWNLFLPHVTEWTPNPVSNVDYAPLAELMGRSAIAPLVFNWAEGGRTPPLPQSARFPTLDPLLRAVGVEPPQGTRLGGFVLVRNAVTQRRIK